MQSDAQLTEPIDIGNVIRQRDSLSYMIFDLFIDEVIKSVNKGRGYRMGKEIKIICYIDDAVLIVQDDLQRLIHRFKTRVNEFIMKPK